MIQRERIKNLFFNRTSPRNAGFTLVISFLLLTGCATSQRGFPGIEGIRNFARVNEKLMRGAQPTAVGYEHLKAFGVRTVINLRMPTDAWPVEGSLALSLGMTYTNIPMTGLGRPTEDQIARVLAVITNSPGPVFVHCKHGCDRAGTVIACYRIQQEGWKAEDALAEAEYYGMSVLEVGMKSFIIDFGKMYKQAGSVNLK